jgi:hypothetical protein
MFMTPCPTVDCAWDGISRLAIWPERQHGQSGDLAGITDAAFRDLSSGSGSYFRAISLRSQPLDFRGSISRARSRSHVPSASASDAVTAPTPGSA